MTRRRPEAALRAARVTVVDSRKKLELLDAQIDAANKGYPSDFDEWRNKTEVVIRQIFGAESPTYKKFEDVEYFPSIYFSGMDTSGYQPAGVLQVISILQSAKLEVELVDGNEPQAVLGDAELTRGDLIFIVHGHNEANKFELSAFLQALTSRAPVILHQQPNRGRVLIEKFEQNAARAGYAVVILSADDEGRGRDGEQLFPRGRQNVVFEMGFFFGALGRQRVAVLYEEGVELPSDVAGLVYIPLDRSGAWKTALARELKDAGIPVDSTALLR